MLIDVVLWSGVAGEDIYVCIYIYWVEEGEVCFWAWL